MTEPNAMLRRIGEGAKWVLWAILFLATLEVGARVDDRLRWGAPFTGRYSHGILVTRDSVTIRGRPNARYEKWAMNSHGFRGPELRSAQSSPGLTRVVVLGASETFGLFESEGHEYPAQMQRMLDSIAPGRFEVVNAALAGMGLSAMVPYLRTVLAPLHPDIVVVYPTPTFFLDNAAPPDTFVLRPLTAQDTATGRRFEPRIRDKVRVVVKRIVPTQIFIAYRQWGLDRARRALGEDQIWSEVPEDRMELFARHLARVTAEIEAIGATPILLTHANRFLYREVPLDLDDNQHLLAVISNYWPRASESVAIGVDSAANRRVRAVASARGAHLLEVERRIPPDAVHFADYSHFTDAGAERVARVVVQGLLSIKSP